MDSFLDFLIKTIKKYSGTILGYFLVFIFLLLVATLNIDINNTLKNTIIISSLLTLFFIYILQIIFEKSIPRSKKKNDILIRVITGSENDYNDFSRKFIDELKVYTKNKTSDFNFLVIPYKATKKSLKYSDEILLKKSNCLLLLTINLSSNIIDSTADYIINFKFSFNKSKYERRIKKRLKYEIKYLTQEISNYHFSNQNILEKYNILICQIYNISYYLNIKLKLFLTGKYDDTIKKRRYTNISIK